MQSRLEPASLASTPRNAGQPQELRRDVPTAPVTNIQGYSIHDGPGIRTIVFLKGCTLSCRWCANPEGVLSKPEVGLIKSLCPRCGNCAAVCPQGALGFDAAGLPHIDRRRCIGCGECASVCGYHALVLYGRQMSVDEVFGAVQADKMFYEASGGGVTASGGEPLLHPEFVRALFEKCRADGIHTCLETSGSAASPALLQVLPFTDCVLYDLKHMDSDVHRQFTSAPNTLVLANARLLAESGVDFLFRMPLIPGINDSADNIRATAAFLKTLGQKAQRIELMPYHRLGESKYMALDREYTLHGLLPVGTAEAAAAQQAFEELGIECSVSA
jgi:pyruvate formate lyase activating enzyme